jgi:hypothetical protein
MPYHAPPKKVGNRSRPPVPLPAFHHFHGEFGPAQKPVATDQTFSSHQSKGELKFAIKWRCVAGYGWLAAS